MPPVGSDTTRPITGAVKKSVFGMLGEDLTGQRVVDLFCGTGTLGIESLSRGAVKCWFADRDPTAIQRLTRNLQDCGAMARAVVWRGDIETQLRRWIGDVTDPIDLAFVDPPYALAREWFASETNETPPGDEVHGDKPAVDSSLPSVGISEHGDKQQPARTGRHASIIESIFDPLAGKLADDGIVVLRNDDLIQVPPTLGKLAAVRTRTYGNMVVTLLRKALGTRQ